ncbi:MAG: hypothetical protein ACLPWG_13775 [Steroidobacteraceae bacterium]
MKKILTGATVLGALTFGVTAHAACMDSSAAHQGTSDQLAPLALEHRPFVSHFEGKGAGERVVGTWHVVYTAGGSPFAQAFIQWNSDGNEWENITQPTLGGNICMGAWKTLDQLHVFRNHVGWIFTNGVVSGYFNETETDTVAWDGNSYTGSNDTKIYDLSGNLQVEIPGTATATRIAP